LLFLEEGLKTMTDRRQLLGLIGSGLLILGTFLPLISVPILGSINYFANGNGDGTLIIGYSVLAIIFTLIKRFTLLWIPAILSLGQLTYALITFSQKMSEASGLIAISMEWGWLVLYAGGILLVMAAVRKAPATPTASPEIG
jgi:hypothetical protein